MVAGGATSAKTGTDKQYKGVLHPDSLLWCRGSIGLEHRKIRKFIYPFYKYSQTQDATVYKIIMCVCQNCNMVFYGEDTLRIPLSIPIYKLDGYSSYELAVKVSGKAQSIKGELIYPFSKVSQEEINDKTRAFIEMTR